MATMVLADFGADVVRVEPPGDARESDEPARPLLQRGKRSVALDIASAAGRDEVRRLARGADVLVEDMGPGRADSLGLADETLRAANPSLVYCSLSGFGSTGPLAHAPADDGLAMAKAGIFRDQLGRFGDGRRPVFRSCRDASYLTAMLAVQGTVAALRAREVIGTGQRVEANMLQALTCRLNPMVRWLLRDGDEPPLGGGYGAAGPDLPSGPQLTGMLLQCKDGRWIVHMVFERNFFPEWIGVLGLDWIWQDDRFKGAPHDLPDLDARIELARLIEERMKEKTAAEWLELYVANGNVCADIVQTTQEALQHPQVVEGGHLVELDDPRVGRVVEVGPLAKLPAAPPSVRGPAPEPGRDTDEILRQEVPPLPRRTPTGAALAGPLEGITIVEAATFYAASAAIAMLAELGARVIKVEPATGDPYRRSVRGMGHDNLVRAMQGKENLAVDLKDERGRAVVHRLVARADAFVHNFRLGVPERLGIDYDTLRSINPRLVYQYSASYGSVGPYRRQPAIDHVIAAFAGTTAYQAGEGNPPLREQGADPVAAAANATAMLLALLARDRTGESQHVESAMIQANLYLNYEDALAYEGKPARPPVDREQRGTGPTYRLYETAPAGPDFRPEPYENPDPRWVFLSATDDDEFARFCRVVGRDDIVADARFATRSARSRHAVELEAILEPLFRTRSASDWELGLQDAGVGCVTADAMSNFAFLYKDPQARAIGMMTKTEHPTLGGTYWRHAPLIRFSQTPGRAGPYCDTGEHSRALLRELGYRDEEITALHDAGVVTLADSRA
jgi:crotonobetainyl-CoA:carnitine CoA-transferase CaiB-like acyl-CoA transferase